MCTKESKMNYKFDGSKVYFTSDTHFYHSNIIGFCKRPFKNIEDMNENRLVRTGHGMYAKVMKQTFAPKPVKEVKEIYELLQANFPFAKFCVYQGEIIAPLHIIFHPTASSMGKRTGTRQNPFLIF